MIELFIFSYQTNEHVSIHSEGCCELSNSNKVNLYT